MLAHITPNIGNTHLRSGTPAEQAQWNKYIEKIRIEVSQDEGFRELDPYSRKMLLTYFTNQKVGATQ